MADGRRRRRINYSSKRSTKKKKKKMMMTRIKKIKLSEKIIIQRVKKLASYRFNQKAISKQVRVENKAREDHYYKTFYKTVAISYYAFGYLGQPQQLNFVDYHF